MRVLGTPIGRQEFVQHFLDVNPQSLTLSSLACQQERISNQCGSSCCCVVSGKVWRRLRPRHMRGETPCGASCVRHVDRSSNQQGLQDRFATVPGLVVPTPPISDSVEFAYITMCPPLVHPWPPPSSVCASRGSGSQGFSLGVCIGTSLQGSRSADERVCPKVEIRGPQEI